MPTSLTSAVHRTELNNGCCPVFTQLNFPFPRREKDLSKVWSVTRVLHLQFTQIIFVFLESMYKPANIHFNTKGSLLQTINVLDDENYDVLGSYSSRLTPIPGGCLVVVGCSDHSSVDWHCTGPVVVVDMRVVEGCTGIVGCSLDLASSWEADYQT